MIKRFLGTAALAAGLALGQWSPAAAEVELSMYYPVAVGGPLTKIVDGLVADFEAANPDIKVNAIYAGNYNDARIKALAALKSGEPAQLSVMFAIDIYELIEGLAEELLSGADGERHDRRQDLGHSVPALDHRDVLQQGRLPGRRSRPRKPAGDLGRTRLRGPEADQDGCLRQRRALGGDDPVDRLPLLDVRRAHQAERPGADEPRGQREARSSGARCARTSWRAGPRSCGTRPAT
jgi:hypothetical protein